MAKQVMIFSIADKADRRVLRLKYRKSLKETRGAYCFITTESASLIQGRVSFEGGSY